MAGDLSQDPAVLLAEIVELQAQISIRQAALARLAARGQAPAPAWDPADDLINIEELAARLGKLDRKAKADVIARRAKSFGELLRAPAWRWLHDLGRRHAVGREGRWRWSEVEAERRARGDA